MINIDHISWSGLREFKKSPAHYLAYLERKKEEPTDAMKRGSAVHCYVLRPDDFEKEYCVAPKLDLRTKNGKEDFGRFRNDNPGKIILSVGEHALVKGIGESIKYEARKYVEVLQTTEQELRWRHPSGIDVLSYLDGVGGDFFLELKTVQDADPKTVRRNAWFEGHIHQMSLYYSGLKEKASIDIPGFLISCEASKPYGCSIFRVDQSVLERVYREVNAWIYEFSEWADTQEAESYQHWVSFKGYYDFEIKF